MIRYQCSINIVVILVFCIMSSFSSGLYAVTEDELNDSYKAFYVDVDGDNLKDIYLKSQPQFIIIALDPDFPIDINRRPDYLLKSASVWGDYSPPVVWTGLQPNLQNATEQNIMVGNTDNATETIEVLIQSAEQGKSSVIASFTEYAPQSLLYEAELSLINGQDISSEISFIALTDVNGDGRDDLIITNRTTGEQSTLLANADGTYGETVAEEEVKVRQAWFGLLKALKQKDITSALTFFSGRSKDQYSQVFSELTNELPAIILEFNNFYRLQITTEFAIFSINRTIDGADQIFFITFVKGDDGSWLLESI